MNKFKFFRGVNSILTRYGTIDVNPNYYGFMTRHPNPTIVEGNVSRPHWVSVHHWNLLPQDIKNSTADHIRVYINGWEDARRNVTNNRYRNTIYHGTWNRGFLKAYLRRGIGLNNLDEREFNTYPEYYDTNEFQFIGVSSIRYSEWSLTPYRVKIYRNISDSVIAAVIEGDRITPEHPMWNFPDVL